jgi:hypothetical protein
MRLWGENLMAMPVPIGQTRSSPQRAKGERGGNLGGGHTRVCARCRRCKPEAQFSVVKHQATKKHLKTYFHPWCNACKRDYNARWMRESRQQTAALSPQFGDDFSAVTATSKGSSEAGSNGENRGLITQYSHLSAYSGQSTHGYARPSFTLFHNSGLQEVSRIPAPSC